MRIFTGPLSASIEAMLTIAPVSRAIMPGSDRARQPHRRAGMDVDEPVTEGRLELGEGTIAAEAGVVDQHVDVGVGGQALLDGDELLPVGKVGGQHLDTRAGLRFEPARERFEPLATAGNDHEVLAVARETFGQRRADAGRRAGDQSDMAVRVHRCLLPGMMRKRA